MRFISRLKRILRRTFNQFVSPKPERLPRKRHAPKKRSIPVYVNRPNKVILGMVNNERRKRHLEPVKFEKDLENHAIKWSKHMAHQSSSSHSGTILENCCMVPIYLDLQQVLLKVCFQPGDPANLIGIG